MLRTATGPSTMKTPASSSAPPSHGGKRHVTGNTSYPQWMRTLEEKYQKLHQKITNNTMITHKYHNLTGKPVYDVRVARALAKYRDIAKGKVPPIKNATEVGSGGGEVNGNTSGNNDAEIENDNDPAFQDPHGEQLQQEEKCLDSEEKFTSATGNNAGFEYDDKHVGICVEAASNLRETDLSDTHKGGQPRIGDREIDVGADTSDKGDKSDDDESLSPDKANSSRTTERHLFNKHELHSKTTRRNISTSLSRVSRNTSKSCPAKIESKKAVKATSSTQQTAVGHSKSASKTRREKMFNKMSLEAQHAITETIQEMNIARSNTSAGPAHSGGVNFVPSRTRKCVKSWSHHSKVDERNKRSKLTTSELIEHASKAKVDNSGVVVPGSPRFAADHVPQDDQSVSSHGSLSDIAGSVDQRGNASRLPEIQKDSAIAPRDKLASKSQHFIIPGIGKYDVKVDDVAFEITPPGFDSRYNDLEPIEDRESETPPPDIRQRAIDKCSEWLTKHGNR